MLVRIAILDDYQGLALELADWRVLGEAVSVQVFTQPASSKGALIERLQDFDAIVAMRERTAFPASVIERLPRLKLLASTGLRNAAIDLEACRRQGVIVCGARGARNGLAATAETAWALILALHKRLLVSHTALRAGHWQPQLAQALEGKVLGIAGLGHIGKRMARIGQAFGMDVIAWSPNLTEERATQAGVRKVGKIELFETAGVVSMHLVLSPTTASVVSRVELAAMQPDAFLINTARAGLVDEDALIDALRLHRIGGAGLDVFWQEPLPPTHPLCGFENVVLTPHLGYATDENMTAYYTHVIRNIQTWMAGETPTSLVG